MKLMNNTRRIIVVLLIALLLMTLFTSSAFAREGCTICKGGLAFDYCREDTYGYEIDTHTYSGGSCEQWLIYSHTDLICIACFSLNRTTIHAC